MKHWKRAILIVNFLILLWYLIDFIRYSNADIKRSVGETKENAVWVGPLTIGPDASFSLRNSGYRFNVCNRIWCESILYQG
jgi:hypothetical protein